MKFIDKILRRKPNSAQEYKVDMNYHEIFQYEYLPTFDETSNDFMIRFCFVKDVNQLIGKLLILIDKLGFEAGQIKDVWMNDEIWISAKSQNGQIIITRDIYDFVFIMATNNRIDLDRIEKVMNNSTDFERIENKN